MPDDPITAAALTQFHREVLLPAFPPARDRVGDNRASRGKGLAARPRRRCHSDPACPDAAIAFVNAMKVHPNDDLAPGTLKSILVQADLKER